MTEKKRKNKTFNKQLQKYRLKTIPIPENSHEDSKQSA